MFWFRLKNFISTLAALATAAVILIGIWGTRISRLSDIEGERIFYLYSPSSQSLRAEELRVRDFPNIKGESVRFDLDSSTALESLVQELTERYGAKVVFTERVDGVTSFYCYTEKWSDGITLDGAMVNLHIAVNQTQCAVGTPIIFDGF